MQSEIRCGSLSFVTEICGKLQNVGRENNDVVLPHFPEQFFYFKRDDDVQRCERLVEKEYPTLSGPRAERRAPSARNVLPASAFVSPLRQ